MASYSAEAPEDIQTEGELEPKYLSPVSQSTDYTHSSDESGLEGTEGPRPRGIMECVDHPGQTYTIYCTKHQVVCCGECHRAKHVTCNVSYLTVLAKGNDDSLEKHHFKQELQEFQTRLKTATDNRAMDLERLTGERKAEVWNITRALGKLIDRLETIEKESINDVDVTYNELKREVECDITVMNKLIVQLGETLDQLENATEDGEVFVIMKSWKQRKTIEEKLKEVEEHVGKKHLQFLINKHAEQTVLGLRSLGTVVSEHLCIAELCGQYCIKTKHDKFTCKVFDICKVDDYTLLLTDWENKCVKRFDGNGTLTDHRNLKSRPGGICQVSLGVVAVTLTVARSVQMLALVRRLSPSRSFKTAHCCRGITSFDGLLYIACGSWEQEGTAYIGIYTISGVVKRTLTDDNQGPIFSSIPLCIKVIEAKGHIVVSDRDHGLICLGPNGERLWFLSKKDVGMETVGSFCVDTLGRVLVSSKDSRKLVQVSATGRKVGDSQTVLNDDDVETLSSVYLDTQESKLYVAYRESDEIRVFRLN